MKYEDALGPRLVGYNLASQAYDYLMRIINLGLISGPIGEMELNPYVKPVIEALHTVLAGGEVELVVKNRGNPDIIRELNRRLEEAGKEANEINKKAGYYVTAAP